MTNRRTDYVVYLDSDGVIADFPSKAAEILGPNWKGTPPQPFWDAIEAANAIEPFFLNLDVMPHAIDGVTAIMDMFEYVNILTATGRNPDMTRIADYAQQKVEYYKRLFPSLPVLTVARSPSKAMYANRAGILIDDKAANVSDWIAAGGRGILHTSWSSTLAQLVMIHRSPISPIPGSAHR